MQVNVNYLTDSRGNKVAVQVPLKQWSQLMDDYNHLKQYYNLKKELKKSFDEINEIEKGKRKASTLSEFLNES